MTSLGRSVFRPLTRAFALEQRILFDGAGAIAAADQLDIQSDDSAHNSAAERDHAPAVDATVANPGGPGNDAPTILLVVDGRIADYESLVAGLSANVILRVVDAGESGIDAISSALEGSSDIESIQIISHGKSGSITLGTDVLDNTNISERSTQLQGWATHLTEDADILLYGCDVAAGPAGDALLTQLAALTGADIAASIDATGAADQGGNWTLEARTGPIEAGLALNALALEAYGQLLDIPVITDSVTDERVVQEDHALTITGISVADSGNHGQVVTLTVTNGTLTLASTAGLTGLSGNGTGLVSFGGTLADINTALDGMTFKGTQDFNGGARLEIKSHDGTVQATRTIEIAVTAVNDAPTLSDPAPALSVAENGTLTFTAAQNTAFGFIQSDLGLSDVDNKQEQVIIKLADLAKHGTLYLDGKELAVGSTFAVSDIGNLSYKHNGSQVLTPTIDRFKFTIDDGAGGVLTNQQFEITINPVNDVPTVSGTIRVIEGETNVNLVENGLLPTIGSERGKITIIDPDQAAGVDYTYALFSGGLPNRGTLYYDGTKITDSNADSVVISDLSLLTYSHDGAEPKNTAYQDSFILRVTDDGGGAGVGSRISEDLTITLDILDNNNDPILAKHQTQDLNALRVSTFTVTSAMLQVTDSDSFPSSLTYTLTSVPDPDQGYFARNGYLLVIGSTFTQDDIDKGRITYHLRSNSTDARTDTIEFIVKDGAISLYPVERDGGIYNGDGLATNTFSVEVPAAHPGDGRGDPLPALPNTEQVPLVSGDKAFTLNESGTYTLSTADLLANDGVTPDASLVYRLNTLPSSGSFYLDGSLLGQFGIFTQDDINQGKVIFKHSGAEDFKSDFQFTVSNGKLVTASHTFEIFATPQNDTPTATVGGDRVFLLEGGTVSITDKHIVLADSDALADASPGAQYAVDNALKFVITALPGRGFLSLDGTTPLGVGAEVTAAQLQSGALKYVHNGGEYFVDSFKLRPVDDQGVVATDGTNQTSTGAELEVPIVISPINDAPVFVGKSELIDGPGQAGAIYEGATAVIGGLGATGAKLVYSDEDNSAIQRQYRVTTPPANGQLMLNGVALGANSVFTQADLDAGHITYRHDGSETSSDLFFYVVSDGDYTANEAGAFAQGETPTSSVFNIEIKPANDKPTIKIAGGGPLILDSAETANAKPLPKITLGDVDVVNGSLPEDNFVQVTVEIDAGGLLVFGATTSVTIIAGDGGTGATRLVFQGKLKDVQNALDDLKAKTDGSDPDRTLQIKVTVDDRNRDNSGALTGGANGGDINTPDKATGVSPDIDDTNNTATITINVSASDKNDTPVVTVGDPKVANEDVRTKLDGISYTDLDAFNSDGNTITLTVISGTLSVDGFTGSKAWDAGSHTLTLTGTKAQLDAALASLYYRSAPDYNGIDTLTITVDDGGNTGRDGSDGTVGTNTATIAIHILPVNDAPTLSMPTGYHSITGAGFTFIGSTAISFDDPSDRNNDISVGFQPAVDAYTVTLKAQKDGDDYGEITVADTTGITITGAGGHTVTYMDAPCLPSSRLVKSAGKDCSRTFGLFVWNLFRCP